MCTAHELFVAVDTVDGEFDFQGFVGLGPQKPAESLSLPISLYNQNQITAPRVGLNYENPIYKDKISTMTFGYFDWNHVHGGSDGLHWFVNKGEDNWSIMLSGIQYNGVDL